MVETKAQLSGLTTLISDNFQPASTSSSPSKDVDILPIASSLKPRETARLADPTGEFQFAQTANERPPLQRSALEVREIRFPLIGDPIALPWIPPHFTTPSIDSNRSRYDTVTQKTDPSSKEIQPTLLANPRSVRRMPTARRTTDPQGLISADVRRGPTSGDRAVPTSRQSTSETIPISGQSTSERPISEPETRSPNTSPIGPFGAGTRAHGQGSNESDKCPDYLKKQIPWTRRPSAPSDGLLTAEWAEGQ